MRLDLKTGTVHLIDLSQESKGFRKFLNSWVVLTKDFNFLVDVGPSSTVPLLIKKLKNLGVSSINYVFLTHIHLDHAGGIGHLAARFPKLKIVAHKKSKPHLLNPEKIWAGSKKILGEMAVKYGEVRPVEPEKLVDEVNEMEGILKVIDAPGHAAHHLAFQCQNILFAGEAGGVYLELEGEDFYLRPATPPRFFFEVANNSLDKLLALNNVEKICYGHYGYAQDATKMLNIYRKQLSLWREVIKSVMETANGKSNEEIALLSFEKLLKEDSIFSRYFKLDKDIQQREKYFVLNSIKGYMGDIGHE